MPTESAFWADHASDMEDPQYALAYLVEQQRVRTIDEIIRTLDECRGVRRLPKTRLARAIGAGDAAGRRLFSRPTAANPTLDTLVRLAARLGLEVTLKPMEPERAAAFEQAFKVGSDQGAAVSDTQKRELQKA